MHEIQLKTLNVCSFQTRYVCIRKHNFLFCTLQLYSSCFKVVLLHLFTNIFVLGGSKKRAMWYAVWAVSTAGKWRSHRKVRVLNEYWRRLAAIPWIWCTTQHSTHHAKWMHFAGIRADDGVLALPNFLTFKADFREANDQIVHYLLQNQWKNFHFWRFGVLQMNLYSVMDFFVPCFALMLLFLFCAICWARAIVLFLLIWEFGL